MAIVPISIDYLGKSEYGIWLTLASILNWFVNLDFGIGNGLRNKLAEALALNNLKIAKIYVSTAYIVFAAGILLAFIIYSVVHSYLNWVKILHSPMQYLELLNSLAYWVIILFLVQFLLKLLSSIINADQSPSLNGLLSLSINFLTLVVVYLLPRNSHNSLFIFALVCSAVPIVIFGIASIILFRGKYKHISPSYKHLDLKYSGGLVKLGLKFFIIQTSAIIIFSTDNIIISQIYGPQYVTTYNIAYKYFYMVPLIFNVVLAPYWSAFTDAFVKKEYEWIKSTVNKLVIIWALLSLLTIVMIVISNTVYKIWIDKDVEVPILLSILTGLFVIIANWNNIFGYFLNGVGKVRLQLYSAIFTALINIPLSIFLAKNMNMGITGVMAATNICLVIAFIWAPIQYHKIITNKAKGIWDK